MHHRNIFAVILTISSQLLSVTSAECVAEFLASKFKTLTVHLNPYLDFIHTNGLSFYTTAITELSDLVITDHTKQIEWYDYSADLEEGSFSLDFVYWGSITLAGTHNTGGLILGRKPFFGQGMFNVSLQIYGNFSVNVLNLQASQTGYLKAGQIQTLLDRYRHGWYFTSFYLENISDNEAIASYVQFLGGVILQALEALKWQTFIQVEAASDKFWRQQISETHLTDVCINI